MSKVVVNKFNESCTISNLHTRVVKRHKHIANFLHNCFKNTHIDQYTLFSISFIWHCQKHLDFDLFDNFCDEVIVTNMLYIHQNVDNKYKFKNFIKLAITALKVIPKVYLRKIVKEFEENNGECGNIPHGFIASEYNVKQLLDNFTQSMFFPN